MCTSLPKEKPSACLKCRARISSCSLFQAKWETEPTTVQLWSKHSPLPTPLSFANKWYNLFKNISKMSTDNKLRQFSFKLLHRILVTKKELKTYKIKPDYEFFFGKRLAGFPRTHIPGSLFAEDVYYEMMMWFNNEQKSQFNMTKQQTLFNDFIPPIGSQHLLKWNSEFSQHQWKSNSTTVKWWKNSHLIINSNKN